MTTVVVPARSLTAGEPITFADVIAVEIPTEVVFSDELVSKADVDAGAIYAGRLLRAGEPILRSSTSDSPQGIDRRTMALPLPDWGAAGGQLEIGDEIDVIDTGGDQPRYIVQPRCDRRSIHERRRWRTRSTAQRLGVDRGHRSSGARCRRRGRRGLVHHRAVGAWLVMFTIAVSWPWGSALRAWANDHGSSNVDVVLIRDRFGAFDDDIDVVCLAPGSGMDRPSSRRRP